MGLKSERSPNTADRRMTQPKMLGHRPRTPMGSSLGSRLQRLGHDFLDLVVRDRALYPGPGFVVQPFQSLCYKATSPLAHRAPHGAQLPRDLRIRQSRRALQHDSGPERLVRRRPSAASQSLKRFGFFRGQLQLSQLPPVVFHALSRSQLDMVCLPFFVPGD